MILGRTHTDEAFEAKGGEDDDDENGDDVKSDKEDDDNDSDDNDEEEEEERSGKVTPSLQFYHQMTNHLERGDSVRLQYLT